jgi:NAD(P)-dependent dehydrogenase (short-subunit alcohol dehydrogenase family)
MGFRVLVVGGTGQVGSALVRALLAAGSCTEVVMANRRTIALAADARLRQVIMDTGAANFESEITELARTCSAQGESLYAASCIGIGKGSQQWSEEDIKKLEIGVVGAFARVAASRRESNDSDFFRQPAAAPRAGFAMPASWAKKKMQCGASDSSVWPFFAPASLRVMHTPRGFLLCSGVSFQDRLGRLIRTISVGLLSVNFSMGTTAPRSWKMPR